MSEVGLSCDSCFRLSPFEMGGVQMCLPRVEDGFHPAGMVCLHFKRVSDGMLRGVPPEHSVSSILAHPAPVRAHYFTAEDFANGCLRVHERRVHFDADRFGVRRKPGRDEV